MTGYLRRVRLTWRQFGGIALLSALATTLVIASAVGHPSTPTAVIAALGRRVVVHRHEAPAVTPVSLASLAASSPSGSGGSSAAASSSTGSGSGNSSASPASGSNTGSGSGTGTGTSTGSTQKTATPRTRAYKVKHVFVIALSAPSYAAAFGHGSMASYLNGKLRPKGTLLSSYETLGGAELPDYLAMVSGQGPNPDTRGDCASYVDFPTTGQPGASGLMPGSGCVYPNTVLTIGDQVTAAGASWKAYIGDMGQNACIHPNSGAFDNQALPFAGSEYDTRHNPFIYFHSLLDLGDCSTDDLSLTALPRALTSAARTPKYAFVAPNSCADSASGPCPNGAAGGLAAEDTFLRTWVPKILASAAYRKSGMLVITFAAAAPAAATSPTSVTTATTTTTAATTTTVTTTTPAAATGGTTPVRIGALVLSPFTKAGKTVSTRYNAYSLLRTSETLLGLKPLGHAAGAKTFIASALPGA
jgi:hypothetical protein